MKQLVPQRIPRSVQAVLPQICWRGNGDKALYLTFDDGPHPEFTPALLDVLAGHGVAATFFLIGSRAARYPELAAQIGRLGHCIGSHAWQHRRLWWQPGKTLARQILRAHRQLSPLPGFRPLLRPPFGQFGPKLLRMAPRLAYRLVLWTLSPEDYAPKWQKRDLSEALLQQVRPGDIVLLHDGHANSATTVQAMQRFIPACLERGFQLRTLREVACNPS